MKYKELTEQEISDFIVNDPKLVYMGFADKELQYMYENKKYHLHPDSFYIGIEKDDVLIGILKWEYFTQNAISVHPYISSKYQGQGLSKEMSKFVCAQLVKDTQIKKVVAFIMEPCEQAIRAVKACGFILQGHVTNCTYWREKLTGVYIYGIDLEQVNNEQTNT